MIIKRIREEIKSGTSIPKPKSKDDYIVDGWGISRGEKALRYLIGVKQHSKYLRISDFEAAYAELYISGKFTRKWFNENLPQSAKDGWCNFTSIGGIFELLGIAIHHEEGCYKKVDIV